MKQNAWFFCGVSMGKSSLALVAVFSAIFGMFAAFPLRSFGADEIQWRIGYLYTIDPQASGASFNNIADIIIDNKHNEALILDNGNSRVVITDTNGTFLFQFSFTDAGIKGFPRSIAVGDDDVIYVAGEQVITVVRYNGTYVKDLDLSSIPDADGIAVKSMAVKGANLYIGDGGKQKRIIVMDRKKEKFIAQYSEGLGNNVRLALDSSGFYVMDPATFSVLRFDEDGKYLSRFGRISSLAGGFSQIADIYVDKKNGRVAVVDYNRVAVIFFNRNGDFLFEFGGPSLFKLPTVAAVDDFNKVYVADSNVIRVFKIEEERFEEPKVDVEPESKPESEPESKPEPEPESKPEPEPEAKPESEAPASP